MTMILATILCILLQFNKSSALDLMENDVDRADLFDSNHSSYMENLRKNIPCPTDRCRCSHYEENDFYLINCRNEPLAVLPHFTPMNITFTELTFSENNLIVLPSFGFKNVSVEKLDLRGNFLGKIERNAFYGLEQPLKALLLQGNGRTPPPYEEISRLSGLKYLHLQNFTQDRISESNYFGSWPLLQKLHLEEMKSFTSIDSLAFKGKMQNLNCLELISLKNLTHIPVKALFDLLNLSKLIIMDTNISRIFSGSFEKLDKLRELDLSHNKISMLDEDVFIGIEDTLVYLDISFNQLRDQKLTSLSSKLWQNLETLSISYNDLRNLSDNIFRTMPRLMYLKLADTGLTHVREGLLSGLKNLHTLDLSSNQIETISPGAFLHTPTLFQLNLELQFDVYGDFIPPNLFLHLSPESLHGLESTLQALNLEYTPVKPNEIWTTMKSLPNLTELKLIKTGLRDIPDFAFYFNQKLELIDLSFNEITTLQSASFWGLQRSLKEVLFNGGNLSGIDRCVFQNFTKLQQIKLYSNPLRCDCHSRWLHDWVTTQNSSVGYIFKSQYVCASPEQHKDVLLADISNENLVCDNEIVTSQCKNYDKLAPITTVAPTQNVTTAESTRNLQLTVVSTTPSSITVAWRIVNKDGVTGYHLTYSFINNNQENSMNIHRDEIYKTLENLQPGQYYTVCLTVEVNLQLGTAKDCKNITTKNRQSNSDTHSQPSDTSDSNLTTITIAAVTSVVVFVVLAIVVIYAMIKYKFRKLKAIELTMTRTQQSGCCSADENDQKISVIPNVYSEPGSVSRNANTLDDGASENPYHTCGSVHPDAVYNKSQTYTTADEIENYYNTDSLPQRHSAPSRLNATDLMKTNTCNASRPLPATPTETTHNSIPANHIDQLDMVDETSSHLQG